MKRQEAKDLLDMLLTEWALTHMDCDPERLVPAFINFAKDHITETCLEPGDVLFDKKWNVNLVVADINETDIFFHGDQGVSRCDLETILQGIKTKSIQLIETIQCPLCHQPLHKLSGGSDLTHGCTPCGRGYRVVDGVVEK